MANGSSGGRRLIGWGITIGVAALFGLLLGPSPDASADTSIRDVLLDPSDATLPDLEDLTFDGVVSEITAYLNDAGPVKLRIPKLGNVGPLLIDEGAITITSATETIEIEGPVTIEDLTFDLTLTLDWEESEVVIPDSKPTVTFAIDWSAGIGIGVDLTVGEMIELVNDLAGTSFDASGQSPASGLIEAGLTFAYDTADGAASIDAEGQFSIDAAPDNLVVGLLLSMSDPAGTGPGKEPTLLTGLRLTDDDLFSDDPISLRQVFRGNEAIAFAADLELPEVTLSMVQPAGANVKKTCAPADTTCVPMTPRTIAWFGSLANDLPGDFAPGNTLTMVAGLRLDSLGAEVRQAFGYPAGTSVLLTGAVGFDVTHLVTGDFTLNDVSLQADLPALAPGDQALLPDWLRLSDGTLKIEYDHTNTMLTFTAEATAAVNIPSQGVSLSIGVEAQITIEESVATIAILVDPSPGNVGWPNVFGLEWLDLTSVGMEVRVIAPEGGPVDVSGALTSSFVIGGQPFSVRLEVELTPTVGTEITVSYDGQISIFDVLDAVGMDSSDLPSNLDATLGPVSVTAHVEPGKPLQLSVGATGGFPLLGPGSAQYLFSLRGSEIVFGVRSTEATLSSIIPDNPFQIADAPTVALVGISAAAGFEDNSFNLSPEEDDFFRGLNGCDPRPATCTAYEVDLDNGIHVLASFQLPEALDGLRDLLPLLWIDPSSGLLLDASAPYPGSGSIDLSSLSVRAVLPAIKPPINPEYPDWFERARLAFEASPEGFEIVGELRIRLRDESVPPTQSATNAACHRSWLETIPGLSGQYACYDRLDFEIGAGVSFAVPPKLTLSGALLTQPGVGWPEPFGIEFLRVDAARIQLGIAPSLSGGVTVDLGLLAAGALFDKDFSGSIAMAMTVQPIPAPPGFSVVPTFNGIRFSSQAGIELADFMDLYDYVTTKATALGLPDLAPDLSGLPNISFRNLDLMVGFASYPDLCIEPGIKLGGTFHINAAPLTVAPPNPPGGCNPGLPVADPVKCAADPTCFASALLVATPDDGIIVSGSLGEFDVGVLQCDQALLDFRLAPTQQVLRAYGGCEVPNLLDGSFDIYVGLDGVAFRGDVELFPGAGSRAFHAEVEGEAHADLSQIDLSDPASWLALDFDLHAVMESDFTGLVRNKLQPLIEDLRLSATAVDLIYQRLLDDPDPLGVLLDLPDLVEEAGGTVPAWLEGLADALSDLDAQLQQYGLQRPNIDDLLGGYDVVITEGTRGFWDPEDTECRVGVEVAGLLVATDELGVVVDGVCWSDPPGGPFGIEFPGVWLDPQCYGMFSSPAGFDIPGPGIVIDGVCWAIPPVSVHINGLHELDDRIPASFAEVVAVVEGRLAAILEPFPGVPNNLSLSTLLDELADALSGASAPFDVACADFRQESVEASTEAVAALRFKGLLFGHELGLALDWDFAADPFDQAEALLDDVVATIFGTADPVECEDIGTTTLAQGSGAPASGQGGAPPLTGFSLTASPTTLTEGGMVTVNGVFNATPTAAVAVTVDWGDDSAPEVLTVPTGVRTFAPTHTYPDDDPKGTGTDTYLVEVTAVGRTKTVPVTVVNAAPSGLQISVAATTEGAVTTLAATFTDPGALDVHRVTVSWGDGTAAEQLTLPVGQRTFSLTHTFVDDNPTGTASDTYTVGVRVRDDDGGQLLGNTPATVANVAPSVSLTPRSSVTEGRRVTYDLRIVDPGARDPHVVTIDWGDGGAPMTLAFAPGVGVATPIAITHLYVDDNPTGTAQDNYTIGLRVVDDDSGDSGPLTMTQSVLDVAPTVQLQVLDGDIDEGGTVSVVGSIYDPGVLDTFQLTIDWGHDAVADTVIDLPAGAYEFSATAVFGDNLTVDVVATVVDDDTLSDSDTGQLIVRNVNPSVAIDESATMAPPPPSGIPTFVVRTGTPLSLTARADDPGSDDLAFAWDFDTRLVGQLDAGTASTSSLVNPPASDPYPSPTVQPRAQVASAVSHTYTQACLYRVGVTAGDDDGGSGVDSTWVVATGTETRIRNSGWWYNAYRKTTLSPTTLECYRQVVNHLSSVFGPSGSGEYWTLDTLAQVQDAANTRQTSDARQLMIRPLVSVWLNVAHGALRWSQMVDTDGTGGPDTLLSQVLRTAEATLNNPGSTRSQLLAQEAILNRIAG
jgi:hypothetical protein